MSFHPVETPPISFEDRWGRRPIINGRDPTDDEVDESFVRETFRILDVFGVRPPTAPSYLDSPSYCDSSTPGARRCNLPPTVAKQIDGVFLAALAAVGVLVFVALKS